MAKIKKVKVCVLRTAGTNCDYETKFAFESAGGEVELIHINRFIRSEKRLFDYQILAIPGGFTYGDDIAAGRILANEFKYKLRQEILKFIEDGKLIIGICNGFQVLVKAGILPGNDGFEQMVTLTLNDSGKFEDRWTYLRVTSYELRVTKCIWTKDLPEIIYLPVAHGEGKFVPKDKEMLERLRQNRQIVFQYSDPEGNLAGYPWNPNGSIENIAGVCDASGRILGMMPHPERHILPTHHPQWMRIGLKKEGNGIKLFRNGVKYAKANL
jgi:phosphoribosylformylglycinamidine synthase